MLFKNVFFYGLAGYVGWMGVQYATNTPVKFPAQPYMMIANIEPSSGTEEGECAVLDDDDAALSENSDCQTPAP